VVLELRHRLRPASPLKLSSGAWQVRPEANSLVVEGELLISNPIAAWR
jgi:hypothetical protein